MCSAKGGIKVLDDYWAVREISSSESWGRRHKPLYKLTDTKEFQVDKEKFISLLSQYINKEDAELALDSYLFKNRSVTETKTTVRSFIYIKARVWIKRILRYDSKKDVSDVRLDKIRRILK